MWKSLLGAVLIVLTAISGVGAKAADYRLLKLNDRYVKWSEPAFGSGATVTYAFATTPQSFPDAINCQAIGPADDMLARSGLSRPHFAVEVRKAFDMWESAANLRFRQVDDPDAADILIGAQRQPRGIAFANVSEKREGSGPIAGIRRAMICFNPLIAWELAPDGNDHSYNVRHVVAHEIGHTIGLDHPGRDGQLMGFDYSEEASPGLKAGDIAGAVRLYGPAPSRTRLRASP